MTGSIKCKILGVTHAVWHTNLKLVTDNEHVFLLCLQLYILSLDCQADPRSFVSSGSITTLILHSQIAWEGQPWI